MTSTLLALLLLGADAKIKCKTVTTVVDCNTCTSSTCTDGIRQWEEGGRCTLMACMHFEPVDAKFWAESDGGTPDGGTK